MNQISTINQVKAHNIELVRHAIRNSTEFTKHSIANETSLSIATTNNILNMLCDSGEVLVVGKNESAVGRPAAKYIYNRDFRHICCIFPASVGSQRYLFYAIYDLLGTIVEQQQIWEEEITCESFEHLIETLLKKDPNIQKISIGIPGYYNEHRIQSCGINSLNDCDLPGLLSQKFPCEFLIENNMNAIAYGLYTTNKQQGDIPSSLAVISLFDGSGPGSGIILNGKIYRGKSNFAGEIVFLPYSNGEIHELITDGTESIIQAITQAVMAYTVILNPETCVLTGENLNAAICTSILTNCKNSVPEAHLPKLLYVSNYNQFYQTGLFQIALQDPYL